MAVSSIIINIEEGADQQVLPMLENVQGLSVFGMKNNQIVAVIEAETFEAVNETLNEITGLERVIGVYPVYAGGHE